MLASMLEKHPDTAYAGEYDFVWRYGHAFKGHDVLHRRDATPVRTAYIRRRLEEVVAGAGGRRLIEKTPSNCYRVPYLLEVLPDAKLVHIIRDGRDVAFSAADVWSGGRMKVHSRESRQAEVQPRLTMGQQVRRMPWVLRVLRAKLRLAHRRVSDFPSLLSFLHRGRRGLRDLRRMALNGSRAAWGPHFPGLGRIRKTFSLLETCALQWSTSVQAVRSATLHLPPDRYFEVRYEELVTRPQEVLPDLLDFLELSREGGIADTMAEGLLQVRANRWSDQLSAEEVACIESVVGALLGDLGYPAGRRVEVPSPPLAVG